MSRTRFVSLGPDSGHGYQNCLKTRRIFVMVEEHRRCISPTAQNVNRHRKTPSRAFVVKQNGCPPLASKIQTEPNSVTDDVHSIRPSTQPAVTLTQTFNPYHLQLLEYANRKLQIFSGNLLHHRKHRSSRRIHKFWIRKRSFNRFTISSIVHNKNDIRPFTHIDIFGESH